jgi:small subunit ribosomal protein S4
MARYHAAKARVNRRLGTLIFENAGAARALERRDSPPGMHPRGRRTSNYGTALSEKQKIKYYYGLGERQLRRFFNTVVHKQGNAGELLLIMCEKRLDNVIRRAGLTKTRPQARQGIVHGHFLVNGIKVTTPSFLVKPGDIITVRAKEPIYNIYKAVIGDAGSNTPDWLSVDAEHLRVNVQGNPGASDISLPVDVNIVVEFLSR